MELALGGHAERQAAPEPGKALGEVVLAASESALVTEVVESPERLSHGAAAEEAAVVRMEVKSVNYEVIRDEPMAQQVVEDGDVEEGPPCKRATDTYRLAPRRGASNVGQVVAPGTWKCSQPLFRVFYKHHFWGYWGQKYSAKDDPT